MKSTPEKRTSDINSEFIKYTHFIRFVIILGVLVCLGLVCYTLKAENSYDIDIFIVIIILTFIYVLHRYHTKLSKLLQKTQDSVNSSNDIRANFISYVNHDLRTPLHILLSMNNMILRESDSPSISDYAKTASVAGSSINFLVNQLLLFSRYETDNINPIKTAFSMTELLNASMFYCIGRCRQKRIQLFYNISELIPGTLLGDPSLTKQIIQTVLINIINNTDAGKIVIKTHWKQEENTDNGIFILTINSTESDVTQIYPYSLKDSMEKKTYTDEDYRNVIGYEIIDHVTAKLNGTIATKHSPDTGIISTLTLPFKIVKDFVDNNKASSPIAKRFTAKKAKLLVVDDNPINIQVVRLLLERTKISIDSAISGEEALNLISKNNYNILLLDYFMPGMNGIELLNKIKSRYPDTYKNSAICIFSANADVTDTNFFMKHGFDEFIPKPIDGEYLENIIRKHLPTELIDEIFYNDDENIDEFNKNLLNTYKDILAKYDIIMDVGLGYMSNDMTQYINMSELFIRNYDKTISTINDLFKQNDYKNLIISVHTLKSNAKLIGAVTLHSIAMAIEQQLENNDTEFIAHALPLLLYEFQKTIMGLNEFLKEYFSNETNIETDTISFAVDRDNFLEQLQDYIENYQPEPATKLIKIILEDNLAEQYNEQLLSINNALCELDYDEALEILKGIL